MRETHNFKIELSLFGLAAIVAMIACNFPTGLYTECEEADRAFYEQTAAKMGLTPETPKYPDGAVYYVCYTDNQLTSIRMEDGEEPDGVNTIPAGTYTGTATFYTTLQNDDGFLEPVCSENNVRVAIDYDGTAQGEIRSICSSESDSDIEEGGMTHHSHVTGLIQGKLLKVDDQLTINYTWHSYFTSPQWETTSLEETVEFEYPYHVQVLENVMTLTPAADVEDYFSFTLHME